MNECKISKTELRRGTVARSSSADVALNARFAGVGHAETRGGKDENRKRKGKKTKGKKTKEGGKTRREQKHSTRSGRGPPHHTHPSPDGGAAAKKREKDESGRKDEKRTEA